MARSSIKSELGKFIVDAGVHKVDTWAQSAFNNIRHDGEFPLCIPLTQNSWVIGPYELHNLGSHKWQIIQGDKAIHTFYSKQAAVFYAVLSKLHKYKTADNILLQDGKVAKCLNDVEIYTSKLQQQRVKQDAFRYQLYTSKYMEAKSSFDMHKLELEKTLTSAKYMKIWEKIL
jgi:hypothetical protein